MSLNYGVRNPTPSLPPSNITLYAAKKPASTNFKNVPAEDWEELLFDNEGVNLGGKTHYGIPFLTEWSNTWRVLRVQKAWRSYCKRMLCESVF